MASRRKWGTLKSADFALVAFALSEFTIRVMRGPIRSGSVTTRGCSDLCNDRLNHKLIQDPGQSLYMLYPSADRNGQKIGMMFDPNRIFLGENVTNVRISCGQTTSVDTDVRSWCGYGGPHGLPQTILVESNVRSCMRTDAHGLLLLVLSREQCPIMYVDIIFSMRTSLQCWPLCMQMYCQSMPW